MSVTQGMGVFQQPANVVRHCFLYLYVAQGEGLFSHNKIIPDPVERQHLFNFVRQTRMATAVSKSLQSCLLAVQVEGTGSCRKRKDTLLWRQKPLPLEPLNLFYSIIFATHRSLSFISKEVLDALHKANPWVPGRQAPRLRIAGQWFPPGGLRVLCDRCQ